MSALAGVKKHVETDPSSTTKNMPNDTQKREFALQESPVEYQTVTKTPNIYQISLDCFIGPTARSITTDEKNLPSPFGSFIDNGKHIE